jgi:osmoprotectant transport system substrate-binding protein
MMGQMLAAHTNLTIERRHNLGSNLVLRALLSGDVDLYPAYTGTLLTAVDALNLPVPKDRSKITELVRDQMARKFGLVLLKRFGLNNTYAMCVPQKIAEQYDLRTIGDLRKVPSLRGAFSSEFLDRADGWPNLARLYGISLQTAPRTMEPELMYVAVSERQADLCSGFSTDWQIKVYKLAVLEDDLNYFPSYHAAPLVRQAVLIRFPIIREVLDRLGGQIDDEAIRLLNAKAVVDKRSEADVAREFLVSRGLTPR